MKTCHYLITIFSTLILVFWSTAAFAQTTVEIKMSTTVGKDNSLFGLSSSQSSKYGNLSVLYFGYPDTTSQRSILEFPLDSIPSNSAIDSATLVLTYNSVNNVGADTIDVHRITRSWNENNSNWKEYDDPSKWSPYGGEFDASIVTSKFDYDNTGMGAGDSLKIPGLGSLVNDWIDYRDSGGASGEANYGMILKERTGLASTYSTFKSAENGDEEISPMLVVYYSAGAPSAPTGVTATDGDNHDKIAVSWNVVAAADSYQVFSSSDSLGSYSYLTSTTSVNDTTYDDTGAPSPTLNAPDSVIATDGTIGSHVALSWPAATVTSGTKLYYKVVAFDSTVASDTSAVNGGFTDDTFGSYLVVRSSGDSDAGYDTLAAGVAAVSYNDSSLPAITNAPSSLSATDGTYQDKIVVSWSGQSVTAGAGRYFKVRADFAGGDTSLFTAGNRGFTDDTIASIQIDTSTAVGGPFTVKTVIADTTEYTHEPLPSGDFIYYKLRAISSSDDSSSFTTAESGNTEFPSSVSGVVIDSVTGKALPGVLVTITPGNFSDNTSASGSYLVNAPPDSNYTAQFTKTFYKTASVSPIITTPADTTVLDTLVLAPGDSSAVLVNIDLDDGSTTNQLQFGFHPIGSLAIDSDLGEVELPPKPVSGAFFDTRFTQNDSLGEGSLIDIRHTVFDTLFFYIELTRADAADNITVTWNTIPDVGQKFTLLEMLGPVPGNSVDMLRDTTHAVTNSAVDFIKIIVGPTSLTSWAMNYATGWNLISLGGRYIDSTLAFVFPTANTPAYSFDGVSYIADSTFSPGLGYWVDFASAYDTTRTAESIDSLILNLSSGWNLVGTISEPIAVTDIDDPSGSIVTIYKNNPSIGYELVTDSLRQGLGYWMKLSQNETIAFRKDGGGAGKRGFQQLASILATSSRLPIDIYTDYGSDKIEILSGDGGNASINERLGLPPPAPYQKFFARFAYENTNGSDKLYVSESLPYEAVIRLTSLGTNRSTILRWDNTDLAAGVYFLTDGLGGSLSPDVDMAGHNELILKGIIETLQFVYTGATPLGIVGT